MRRQERDEPTDRWLQGFTLGEMLRTGCDYPTAARRGIVHWQEQGRMQEQLERERSADGD